MGHLKTYPNLVVMHPFSKAYALVGARLGILAAAPLRKILPPYPLAIPSVYAALRALFSFVLILDEGANPRGEGRAGEVGSSAECLA
ncbi:aminotransferase class I/II-fold pyridoxal phosphate-dependent enzyme [Pajaroellobacter abortibovis]|uniref:Aminotransferase class I/classII large domain-containing protein n=1 Tax=Pajaroellobacter abortibovis TaxID=1882918 RepID=A0A1L6MYS1_9BACT|nr:aminotransferase class I/II-fold pyridoxal phosphate-dependent enzyme [Pajaroellobacter abortibovis]APS00731.1 hypothetical protein BCY86_08610 [Pajaroellobacter abortibovis]